MTRWSAGTCGTSSVMIVKNTIFSCKTLLWVRLSTNAGGVPSALPYMNTAVPGTRIGGSAAISASSIFTGERLLGDASREDFAPALPCRHHEIQRDGDHQGHPAAVPDLERVRGQEREINDQKHSGDGSGFGNAPAPYFATHDVEHHRRQRHERR